MSFCHAEYHSLEFGLYGYTTKSSLKPRSSVYALDEQVCVRWGSKASYHKNNFDNVRRTYYYDIRDCSNLYLLMRGKCASFLSADLCSVLLLVIPSFQANSPYCFYHLYLIFLSHFHSMIVISISYQVSNIIIVCLLYPFVFFQLSSYLWFFKLFSILFKFVFKRVVLI